MLTTKLLISTAGAIFAGATVAVALTIILQSLAIPEWIENVEKTLISTEIDNLAQVSLQKSEFANEFFQRVSGEVDGLCIFAQDVIRNEIPLGLYEDSRLLPRYSGFMSNLTDVPGYNTTLHASFEVTGWYQCNNESTRNDSFGNCMSLTDWTDLPFASRQQLNESDPSEVVFRALHHSGLKRAPTGQFALAFDSHGLFRGYPFVYGPSFSTWEGICEATGQFQRGYDPRCRGWYTQAISNSGVQFTSPYFYASEGQELGVTAAKAFYNFKDLDSSQQPSPGTPLMPDSNQTPYGVCMLDISIQDVIATITELGPEEGGYGYIVKLGSGDAVAHPLLDWNTATSAPNIIDLEFKDPNGAEARMFKSTVLASILRGDADVATYEKDGDVWYLAYQPIPTAGYSVVLTASESSIRKPFRRLYLQVGTILGVIGAILLGALVVAVVITSFYAVRLSREVVRPVRALLSHIQRLNNSPSHKTRRLLRGKKPDGIQYVSRELAALQRVFHKMFTSVDMGRISLLHRNWKEAETQFQEAIEFFTRVDNVQGVGACYANLANLFFTRGAYTKAIEYFYASISSAYDLLQLTAPDRAEVTSQYSDDSASYIAAQQSSWWAETTPRHDSIVSPSSSIRGTPAGAISQQQSMRTESETITGESPVHTVIELATIRATLTQKALTTHSEALTALAMRQVFLSAALTSRAKHNLYKCMPELFASFDCPHLASKELCFLESPMSLHEIVDDLAKASGIITNAIELLRNGGSSRVLFEARCIAVFVVCLRLELETIRAQSWDEGMHADASTSDVFTIGHSMTNGAAPDNYEIQTSNIRSQSELLEEAERAVAALDVTAHKLTASIVRARRAASEEEISSKDTKRHYAIMKTSTQTIKDIQSRVAATRGRLLVAKGQCLDALQEYDVALTISQRISKDVMRLASEGMLTALRRLGNEEARKRVESQLLPYEHWGRDIAIVVDATRPELFRASFELLPNLLNSLNKHIFLNDRIFLLVAHQTYIRQVCCAQTMGIGRTRRKTIQTLLETFQTKVLPNGKSAMTTGLDSNIHASTMKDIVPTIRFDCEDNSVKRTCVVFCLVPDNVVDTSSSAGSSSDTFNQNTQPIKSTHSTQQLQSNDHSSVHPTSTDHSSIHSKSTDHSKIHSKSTDHSNIHPTSTYHSTQNNKTRLTVHTQNTKNRFVYVCMGLQMGYISDTSMQQNTIEVSSNPTLVTNVSDSSQNGMDTNNEQNVQHANETKLSISPVDDIESLHNQSTQNDLTDLTNTHLSCAVNPMAYSSQRDWQEEIEDVHEIIDVQGKYSKDTFHALGLYLQNIDE